MNRLLMVVLLFFVGQTHASEGSVETIPTWLKIKLDSDNHHIYSGRSIYLTEYNKQKSYYVSPTCCDIASELYTEDGNLICRPDGGYAGGDGKCPGFVFLESAQTKIWPITK